MAKFVAFPYATRLAGALIAAAMIAALTGAAEAGCAVAKAETDINGLRLHDRDSVERLLGKTESLPFDHAPPGDAHPGLSRDNTNFVVAYNRDKSEMAVLGAPPGDDPASFSWIQVNPGAPVNYKSMVADVVHFTTERGVMLGVSEAFVTDRLGSCFTRKGLKGKDTSLEYVITDPRHAALRRTKAERYFGRYDFKNGRLVSFLLVL